MLTLKHGEESEWLCSKTQAMLTKIYFSTIKKNEHICTFAFLHTEMGTTPLSAFLFLILIIYLHNLWKFCTANYFHAIKKKFVAVLQMYWQDLKSVDMDNHINYHTDLNLAVFSKKATEPQQWNNLPGWLLRSPSGAITARFVVLSLWGTCG